MKAHNKVIILCIALVAFCTPQVTMAASSELQDVPYQFDAKKVEASDDSFHFLRAFVDLFYLSFQANQKNLSIVSKLSQTTGWCVGDAHAENFGFLLQENKSPLFTMNDMDDSGPCPVVLDLYRLMVSSKLYDSNTNLNNMLSAYIEGIKNSDYNFPQSIKDMTIKAIKKGMAPSDKKVQNNKIIRDSQMLEINPLVRAQLIQSLNVYKGILNPNFKILDMVATSKVGGGSAGLLRYEVAGFGAMRATWFHSAALVQAMTASNRCAKRVHGRADGFAGVRETYVR